MLYSILGVLPMISSALLFPINSQFLEQSDYGLVAMANFMQGAIAVFIPLGVLGLIYRFAIEYEGDANRLRHFQGHIFTQILFQGVGFFALMMVFGDLIFNLTWSGKLSFAEFGPYIILSGLVLALNQSAIISSRAFEHLWTVVLFSILPLAGSLIGALIGIVFLEMGALGNIAGKSIGLFCASFPLYVIFLFRVKFRWDWALARNFLSGGVFLLVYGLLGILSKELDKLIVGNLFSESELGVFSIATVIVLPVGVILTAVWQAAGPNMYRSMHRYANSTLHSGEELSEAGKTLRFHFEFILYLSVFLVLGAMAAAEPALWLLASPKFYGAAMYVPVLLTAVLGRGLFVLYSFEVFYAKRTYKLTIAQVAAVGISAVCSYFLVRKMGILGGAFTALIHQYVLTLTVIVLHWRHFNLRFFPLRPLAFQMGVFVMVAVLYLGDLSPEGGFLLRTFGGGSGVLIVLGEMILLVKRYRYPVILLGRRLL